MATYKIKDQQIIIPDSWKEVKLHQAKKFFGTITGYSESELSLAYNSLVENHTYDKIPLDQKAEIDSDLIELLESKPSTEMKREFNIQGQVFYLEYDLTRMLEDEYQDLFYLSANKNVWAECEDVLAILIRPIKEQPKKKKSMFDFYKRKNPVDISNYELQEYDISSRNARAKLILDLSVDETYSIMVFFWTIGIHYTRNLIQSLNPKTLTPLK